VGGEWDVADTRRAGVRRVLDWVLGVRVCIVIVEGPGGGYDVEDAVPRAVDELGSQDVCCYSLRLVMEVRVKKLLQFNAISGKTCNCD